MITHSAATSILFHYTELNKLLPILRDDKFVLTATIGADTEAKFSDKDYYMSFTRSRVGSYTLGSAGTGGVLLTLDGDKFNQRYITKAIDYYKESTRRDFKGNYEMEDRLFSNNPTIPKARSYIRQIDLLLQKDIVRLDLPMKRHLRMILLLCKKYHTPIAVYRDVNSWLTGNRAKAIAVNFDDLKIKNSKQSFYTDRSVTRDQYKTITKYGQSRLVVYMLELYHKSQYSELTPKCESYLSHVLSDPNYEYSEFQSKVADGRLGGELSKRKYVESVIKILQSNKQSLRQFYDSIVVKWRSIKLQRSI
jgi:RNase P subunit RPR2